MLSEEPATRKKALQYVDHAIELTGPQAALLDTKGMCLVHMGRSEEAVELLEKVAASPDGDPRYRFHLAVALYKVGVTQNQPRELKKARAALEQSLEDGLEDQILTTLDETLLSTLKQELD